MDLMEYERFVSIRRCNFNTVRCGTMSQEYKRTRVEIVKRKSTKIWKSGRSVALEKIGTGEPSNAKKLPKKVKREDVKSGKPQFTF
ncbi:hypothetical protein F2Q68_00005938 [Brassica cretica]|uniref:Uncharacterized protein n=1 Tax=Brassica cretica TaxID=69181 RepID=A0A8S9JJ40_BRACR|nr:hypothetical protein F2Q68_00005938 [Brassica cretica]